MKAYNVAWVKSTFYVVVPRMTYDPKIMMMAYRNVPALEF